MTAPATAGDRGPRGQCAGTPGRGQTPPLLPAAGHEVLRRPLFYIVCGRGEGEGKRKRNKRFGVWVSQRRVEESTEYSVWVGQVHRTQNPFRSVIVCTQTSPACAYLMPAAGCRPLQTYVLTCVFLLCMIDISFPDQTFPGSRDRVLTYVYSSKRFIQAETPRVRVPIY